MQQRLKLAKANIYGNLNYSSAKEIQVPDGAVQGETKYTQIAKNENDTKISDYIIGAASAVIFTLVVYGLALLFSKNSIEKCTKIASKKILPAFGIGLLALIVVPIVSFLLLISVVGVSVSLVLLLFYGLLLTISVSTLVISLANIIAEKMKISNAWLKALCVAIVSLLAYVLEVIPYGIILRILFITFGFGILIMNMFFKNISFEKKEKQNKSEK